MKRIIMLLAVACTGIFIVTCVKAQKGGSVEEIALTAFRESGARHLQTTFSAWGKLSDGFIDMEAMEVAATAIADGMNIGSDRDIHKTVNSSDVLRQLVLDGIDDNGRTVTAEVRSCIAAGEKQPGTYISITVIDERDFNGEGFGDVMAVKDNMEKIFKNFGMGGNIGFFVVGTFDGKLERDEILKTGNKISEMEKSDNLNCTISYNSCEDKTYLTIGTPVPGGEH